MTFTNPQIGDKITVFHDRQVVPEIRTIARVLKTSIEDSKGAKWTLIWGKEVGRGEVWNAPRAKPYQPEHDAEIETAKRECMLQWRRTCCRDYNWTNASDQTIEAVYQIIQEKK